MSNSFKAVLLSIFFYPGTGHLFLKKQFIGCAFIVLFSVPLFLLIKDLLVKVNQIVSKIETGAIPLNLPSITEVASQLNADAHALTFNIYFMMAIWFISAIDAYRLGKVEIKH